MAEELDLNKLRQQAKESRPGQQEKAQDSREDLLKKADELDARKQRFASLDALAKQAEAKNAGFDTIEEYEQEQGLRLSDPNLYRLRATMQSNQ